MSNQQFKPEHINATTDDLSGNEGIGRYVLMPGSDGRAKEIAQHFENVTVKSHPRAHNLYLGTLTHEGKKIDVATVSSGMGCPSTEIIMHELFYLGAKRFLRIGTAGSLQDSLDIGDLVNVQASVRDESTTTHYVPLEFPAVASLEFVNAINLAAKNSGLLKIMQTGIVQCKSSLYAREFGAGPMGKENQAYLHLLSAAGVLASEMETATLFIQSHFYNHQLVKLGNGPAHRVLAGAILSIVGTPKDSYSHSVKVSTAIEDTILLAINSIKILATQELIG